VARELARVAAGGDPPTAKLEGALEIVFGAFGESGPEFAHLLLDGWARAAADGDYRLVMAWLREQFRLSIEEILEEGVLAGAFRADLDAAAVASVILGAAEGCLLQCGSQGGAVPTERLMQALMRLAVATDSPASPLAPSRSAPRRIS
jgi:BetI-type transcriptional repressor, C-terminal